MIGWPSPCTPQRTPNPTRSLRQPQRPELHLAHYPGRPAGYLVPALRVRSNSVCEGGAGNLNPAHTQGSWPCTHCSWVRTMHTSTAARLARPWSPVLEYPSSAPTASCSAEAAARVSRSTARSCSKSPAPRQAAATREASCRPPGAGSCAQALGQQQAVPVAAADAECMASAGPASAHDRPMITRGSLMWLVRRTQCPSSSTHPALPAHVQHYSADAAKQVQAECLQCRRQNRRCM